MSRLTEFQLTCIYYTKRILHTKRLISLTGTLEERMRRKVVCRYLKKSVSRHKAHYTFFIHFGYFDRRRARQICDCKRN